MTGLLEQAGAQAKQQIPFAPLWCESLWAGLYTNRSPLIDPSGLYERKFLGGRISYLIGGKNVEVSVRNSIIRRPGLSAFSTATYPTPPQRAFSFEDTNGTIRVLVDTGSTGSLTLSAMGASSGGSAVATGTFPNAGSNAYAGLIFQTSGFTNLGNNFTAVCTASTTTTLTLTVSTAVAETHAGTAVSAGAIYYDQQNGSKTLLKAKQPGAGQTNGIGVDGVFYAGDGVDTWIYTPDNSNGTTWGWGIDAPTVQPSVTIIPSGSASVQWAANTVWSTMGLVYDSANSAMYQLQSVNASTTNTTQFGTTGDGQPAWSGIGGTTSDNTITWTNAGPVVLWSENTTYNNASVGGTATNPCCVYDPNTKTLQINIEPSNAAGKSGGTAPKFSGAAGGITHDGQVKWQCIGLPGTWKKSTAYPQIGHVAGNVGAVVVEPTSLANGLPSNQTVYIQFSSGGTSASSATSPFNASTNLAGTQTTDGDLIWLSLGSDQWAATTAYSAWSQQGTAFNAIKDSNGNFQVCIQTGTSATVQPGTSYTLSAAANASGGNTVYTGTFSPTMPVSSSSVTINAVISGFTNAANNGTFKVISCTATQLTVTNASGVSESHAGTAVYNPWGTGYLNQTVDGSVVWTCVGTASGMGWAADTKWYFPIGGFAPPSSSQPYGGASVIDSNSNVEFIINSGLGGGSAPSWASIGGYTDDGGTSYTLSQVAVSGGIATYTGTGLSGLAGQTLLVSGFTNAGNNVLISVLTAASTTITCTATSQQNETHAGAAKSGAIWYNLEAFSANSLAWTKGYVYAYSYKSRSLDDYYSVADPTTNALPIPPGLKNALPAPTGSLTGDVSTASPVYTITGSDTGAVNTITGLYSNDPAVDTIIIWRSADGGGSANMFELTEIPNVVNGPSPTWSFQDYLPDTPTSIYPGLDELVPAPIDDQNDPPPSNLIPQEYNFQRIWGISGNQVLFSGGPDTQVGNPQSCWNPSDEFPFLSSPIRCVRTTQGLLVFTKNSIEIVRGGPETSSFYSVTLAPGIGLGNFNGLDSYAGEQYFMDTTGQLRVLSPTLSLTGAGHPIADQLLKFNPETAYVAFAELPNDVALYVGTGSSTYSGSTGWFRMAPRQIPGGLNGPEPTWSPFAAITGGCQMLQSVEVSAGVKQLLVGSTSANEEILKRDFTTNEDNGSTYDANFQLGSLWLARRGELAILKFVEFDFATVTTDPTVSYLLNEVSGAFTDFALAPLNDPPAIYGSGSGSESYNAFRYMFAGNGSLARCVHMQIGVDFGSVNQADEVYDFTVYGAVAKNF